MPVVASDANARITTWNLAAARLFGWELAEVIGADSPIVPPSKTLEHEDLVRKTLAGETIVGLETIRLSRRRVHSREDFHSSGARRSSGTCRQHHGAGRHHRPQTHRGRAGQARIAGPAGAKDDIELSFRHEARQSWILSDPSQLDQVVANLAINARDAMPGGGRLTIATRNAASLPDSSSDSNARPENWVVLEIADTGMASTRRLARKFSSPSSQPRLTAKVQAWASPPCTGSSSKAAATSTWILSQGTAHALSCIFPPSIRRRRLLASRNPRKRLLMRAAAQPFSSLTTRPRFARPSSRFFAPPDIASSKRKLPPKRWNLPERMPANWTFS